MNAAEQLEPTISEPLTWAEICERYPDEWVCVADIIYDHPRVFDVRTARVVCVLCVAEFTVLGSR